MLFLLLISTQTPRTSSANVATLQAQRPGPHGGGCRMLCLAFGTSFDAQPTAPTLQLVIGREIFTLPLGNPDNQLASGQSRCIS